VAPLDALLDGIALVGVKTAELVLDVVTKLLADVEQRLALDVQHLRQGVNTHFLLCQAQLLLCRSLLWLRSRRGRRVISFAPF
jgi:hypothetical protein